MVKIMDFAANIKLLRKELNLTQAELAKKIGKNTRTIIAWEKNENRPSDNTIADIALKMNISPLWLREGKGEIKDEIESIISHDDEFVHVPLLDDVRAAAGVGYMVEDERASRVLSFRRDWIAKSNISVNSLSAIHVSGDSMYPTFINGDILLVDCSQVQPHTDRVFVVSTDDGVVVKRSGGLRGSTLKLISDNPAIRDRDIDLNDENVRIVGRVVWFGRTI